MLPSEIVETVCGFCSTGCGLWVHRQGAEPVNVTPARNYPVNLGMACPKGWEALAPLRVPDRGVTPLFRAQKGGEASPLGWDEAVEVFVQKVRRLRDSHGEESFAFLGTGQMTTEEMALLGTVFKVGMGFLHGDSNTRQCMATTHVAYRESFGFDAPPFAYSDFEESDLLIFVGANPCIAHPILWQRVLMNTRKPTIVVVDPRRTETAPIPRDTPGLNVFWMHFPPRRLRRLVAFRQPSFGRWVKELPPPSAYPFGGLWESTKGTRRFALLRPSSTSH
jgi:assimilatory nitrate reductase catalytic subunit